MLGVIGTAEIKKMQAGGYINASEAMICKNIFNLSDAQKYLSESDYKSFLKLYNAAIKKNQKGLMDLETYTGIKNKLIEVFEICGPYELYSGDKSMISIGLQKRNEWSCQATSIGNEILKSIQDSSSHISENLIKFDMASKEVIETMLFYAIYNNEDRIFHSSEAKGKQYYLINKAELISLKAMLNTFKSLTKDSFNEIREFEPDLYKRCVDISKNNGGDRVKWRAIILQIYEMCTSFAGNDDENLKTDDAFALEEAYQITDLITRELPEKFEARNAILMLINKEY